MIRTLLLGAAAAALSAAASAQTFAVRNGTVWTGTEAGSFQNGVVVIEDGEIAAVGDASTAIPDDATVIDADGGWVTPGVIAAYSQIGIVEVGAEDSTDDRSAAMSLYSAALDAAEGFNPSATTIPVSRIEGVTRVVVSPSPATTVFAGAGFVADTSGAPDSITKPDAFMRVYLGEGGAAVAGGSRPAAWAQLRAGLADARTFPARFLAHNEGDALTRVDAQALGPAARGQQLLLISAHRASDLRAIIAFQEDNSSLDIAIVGADEGWMVAEELAEAGIPVIINPTSNLPSSFSNLASTLENAARLIEAGVATAFAYRDDDSHQARLTLQAAGLAVANGVEHDDALAAITRVPAEIFDLDGLGVLEDGAVGDVVVWDGDPLEVTSSPTAVLINGELQSLESRQTRLRDRYSSLERSDRPFAYRKP
ncbi:MAG: amidohydrolase family protein [Pseudomonadota bacterium]